MRNKIKQLLKQEGGFTLVELLGVIVILGIIVAISIPLIGNVIENAEEKTADSQKELVIDAAQMYYLQNEADTVDTETLMSDGYLESKYSGEKMTITRTEAEAGELKAKAESIK